MIESGFRLFCLRILGFIILGCERLGLCFWRPFTWCLGFLALSLFGVPASFGFYATLFAFILFIIGFVYFLMRDSLSFRLPSKEDIDRRIEIDSGVANRPLSSLHDSLANDDLHKTREMWARSRDVLRGLLSALNPPALKPRLAKRDPYAIRLLVFMAFAVSVLYAGPEWSVRLGDALKPFNLSRDGSVNADRYTLIITAPDYTARNPLILNAKTIKNSVIEIPQHSQIKALVNGGLGTPKLSIGEDSYSFEQAIEVDVPDNDGLLRLKQGLFTLAEWPYTVLIDTAPQLIVSEDAPDILDNGTFGIGLSVEDDYGVQYLDMAVTLDSLVEDPPLMGKRKDVRRSIISPDGEVFEISPIYDLAAHPWAGLPIDVTLSAVDDATQTSQPVVIKMQLPERDFQHPIAKTLIALRKELIWNPSLQSTYDKIAYDAFILSQAKELLNEDIVVYLALKSISLRLQYNAPSLETATSVMALMWDTALRVEDGDLSLAARRLRDAQAALEEALQDPNIDEETLSKLMQEFRSAMAEYLREMAREMQKRLAEGETLPIMPDANNRLNQDALADFLDQMEEAMRNGDTKSAQEMLSQMQRLMDMMNPSMQAQMPQDMQMMQDGISELQQLIEKQEALLEQTEKQADLMNMLNNLGLNKQQNRRLDNGEEALPFVNTEDNQVEQEALRFILGKLMLEANKKLDEIPESMGLAEQEMRGSSEELGFNNPLDSIPYQMRAIEYLKESQDQMMQQLQQRMVEMTGFMLSFSGTPSVKRDPLGRPLSPSGTNGDPNAESDIKIPDKAERQRVQEIIELLRRRAGDGSRSREERDYYRRLLKRF